MKCYKALVLFLGEVVALGSLFSFSFSFFDEFIPRVCVYTAHLEVIVTLVVGFRRPMMDMVT